MKPIIGVMPLWDDEKDSIWMLPGYMDGIIEAGGTPIIFPFSDDAEELTGLVKLCGGILFTGGHDVSPELYREEALPGLVSCCEKRDIMESIVLRAAMEHINPFSASAAGSSSSTLPWAAPYIRTCPHSTRPAWSITNAPHTMYPYTMLSLRKIRRCLTA